MPNLIETIDPQVIVSLEDVSVALPKGGDRAFGIQGLNLKLRRNEVVCVVGESGSGKSLTARAITGLLPDSLRASGRILLDGESLLEAGERRLRDLRGAEIGMVFQEPMTALNPLMRVGKQIEEVLLIHTQLDTRARREKLEEILLEVHLNDIERVLSSYPHELSGGQRQRVMIAMALILHPGVLLADEPTTALDVTTQAQVLRLISELQRKHAMAILFITHDFGVVAEIADRVVVMRDGRVVESGLAEDVLQNPKHDYTRALLAAVPKLTTGRSALQGERPIKISTTQLTKIYHQSGGWWRRKDRKNSSGVKATDIQVRRGETLGIVGESGSGKSTLARLIVNLLEADAGAVHLDGKAVDFQHAVPSKAFRKKVQIVFQDPFGSLNPRLRVVDIIAAGPIVHGVPRSQALSRARELLELVGLESQAADRYPHQFSGGQRQRIAVARAIALEPEVLVADEPLSALDVSVQAQVLRLLEDLKQRLGLTMIFITHDLRVASQVCDTVAVMRLGEVVEYASAQKVFTQPDHPYTQQLFQSIPGRIWSGAAPELLAA
ncbi:dipeptide ABC transporter ATP-binding protein [Ottowia thiooxydans]|uniref:dipeptide ABC transporter ATP-binding protein n=1 Tax=Ottowia thiooxydans TaxID=219182 RepID=UPI00041FF0CD|nr:ABC transporter ATP-binding protein [Ottowia thiooxydans]